MGWDKIGFIVGGILEPSKVKYWNRHHYRCEYEYNEKLIIIIWVFSLTIKTTKEMQKSTKPFTSNLVVDDIFNSCLHASNWCMGKKEMARVQREIKQVLQA